MKWSVMKYSHDLVGHVPTQTVRKRISGSDALWLVGGFSGIGLGVHSR